jgi:hypothetical protein
VSSVREGYFLLRECLYFVPHNIDTSTERGYEAMCAANDQMRTFRQRHSTLIHPLYMHLQAVGVPDNGYSLSYQYPGGPVEKLRRTVRARSKWECTEIIMCGQFPSLAITFKRSIVSALPTTSSNVCGLYFSTLCKDVGCFVPKMLRH